MDVEICNLVFEQDSLSNLGIQPSQPRCFIQNNNSRNVFLPSNKLLDISSTHINHIISISICTSKAICIPTSISNIIILNISFPMFSSHPSTFPHRHGTVVPCYKLRTATSPHDVGRGNLGIHQNRGKSAAGVEFVCLMGWDSYKRSVESTQK